MLGGRRAPLLGRADPTLTRDQGSNGGLIGEQDAGPVSKGDLSLIAADGLNDHGGWFVWYETSIGGQRGAERPQWTLSRPSQWRRPAPGDSLPYPAAVS